jgi:putative peptide zinc metalloprotease protein
MADPAKLEFLTRHRDEPGFRTLEVQSSQAYLQFRPKRLPPSEWELTAQPRGADGSENHVLRSSRRDRYLLLSAQEHFLWQCFDGQYSLTEVGRIFHYRFGAFDYSIIHQLIAKLYAAGLIEEFGDYRLQPSLAGPERRWWARGWKAIGRRWKRLSFRVLNADRYCTAIYQRGGFLLFNRFACAGVLAIAISAIVAVFLLAPRAMLISSRLAGIPVLSAVVLAGILLVVSMLHVLVHALACKAYGRRVREMGFFLLQGVLPTFYADVTDIFMSSRRARIIVDLAGPMVEVAGGGLAFLGAYASAPGIGQSLLFGAGIVLWESALLNLYPFNFLELDGYNILADLLAMPALRQQALGLLPELRARRGHVARLHKADWIQLVYLVLCSVSVLVYVVLHLDALGFSLGAWRK